MNPENLIIPVTKGPKPPPLPEDQFEFNIDRTARKVAGMLGWLAGKECVRVQTNRWFTIDTKLSLPDATLGMVRQIQCNMRIEGLVESSRAAAQQFLAVALASDFKFVAFCDRVLSMAIAEYSTQIDALFVTNLRKPERLAHLQQALVEALCNAGLEVKRVLTTPVTNDVRTTLDLADANHPLQITSTSTLEAHVVGYKMRLGWGHSDAEVAARLTYEGSFDGRTLGPALRNPSVAGQTQPLEHWLRTLLAEALSREKWSEVVAGGQEMQRRVTQQVSALLGRGTGRVVETLVVHPVNDSALPNVKGTSKFSARYPITGLKGEGIEVEHAIQYTLVDRDRWRAQGAKDPQAFLKEEITEAAKQFLIDKRFEAIVRLFLSGADGELAFRDSIERRVGPAVRAIGYSLDSVVTILNIPEMDFIHGRLLKLTERTYGLAEAHVAPPMTVETRVRVRTGVNGGAQFARALATYPDFEASVLADIEELVRSRLRGVSALSYYTSPFVNGVPTIQDEATGEWRSLPAGDSSLQSEVRAALDSSLGQKFGLESAEFRIVPGHDPLLQRMAALSRLPLTQEFDLAFARGGEQTTIRVKALATLFIASIAPEHWESFHHNTSRLSLEDHIAKIRSTLEQTLKLLEAIVISAPAEAMQGVAVKEQIVHRFTRRMSEELGLVVRLDPLLLTVVRPTAGHVAELEIAELTQELRELYERRRALREEQSGFVRGETYEGLTGRIEQVKKQIEVARAAQEAHLETTQTVRIEQDRRTGRLLQGPPPAPAAGLSPAH